MTPSPLRKFVLPSLITSGIVFAVMTVPLGIMGDNQVGIKVQEESLFYGKLRDIAAPYVIFATLLSIGTGISVAALGALGDSTRESLDYKNELFRVREDLQQKQQLLQELQFSESRLQASGLNSFLPDEIKDSQPVKTSFTTVPLPPTTTSESISEPVVEQAQPSLPTVENPYNYQQNKQQNNISWQATNNTITEVEATADVDQTNKTNSARSEYEELQGQLQDLMDKMQQLQMKTQSMYE